MKKLTLYLFSLLSSANLFAQTPENIIAQARYKLTHYYDTTNTTLNTQENYDLLLGKNSSVFKSYDKFIQDSIMRAEFARTKAVAPPQGRKANREEIYFYKLEQKLFTTTSLLVGNYMVERSNPKIKWEILPENKVIAGYQAQKAVGDFNGRNYTAWFTLELPFNAGPWKLNNLPGLILEAIDSTNRIKFELISFKNISNSQETTIWDKKLSTITWDEYKKLAKAYQDDPKGFTEKRIGAVITSVNGKPIPTQNPLMPKKAFNFPLEALEFYTIQQ
ncbi:GLPGLI family protein [Pedobacter alpinus]|uniref:GLPGLI family protein n=1 Tax=Pedobacter alpinus TaxID=1590643 RepID=A0ABW5TQM8_9SPHI